jgi:hypothetical protein
MVTIPRQIEWTRDDYHRLGDLGLFAGRWPHQRFHQALGGGATHPVARPDLFPRPQFASPRFLVEPRRD